MTHSLSSAGISILSQKIATFIYQEMEIKIAFEYIIFNYFNFFESSKVVLINLVAILMISARLAAIGVLKIKVFPHKGYDVIILSMMSSTKCFHVTQIIL